MYKELENYIRERLTDTKDISPERKNDLLELASLISKRMQSEKDVNLIFICTHNSRRSHLGHIWAATAASFYGLGSRINTFSGGTETTAFNPRAVAALQRAGFQIEKDDGDNPRYAVSNSPEDKPVISFSKRYDQPPNPREDFIAVMTCSEADENCPYIPGALKRFSITYEDPKIADGEPHEADKYDERCSEIACEMFYLMIKVKDSIS